MNFTLKEINLYRGEAIPTDIRTYIKETITLPNVPATTPSIDFLGLTLLNLCFPQFLPIKYAKL